MFLDLLTFRFSRKFPLFCRVKKKFLSATKKTVLYEETNVALVKINLSSKDKLTFFGKGKFGVFKCNNSVFIILFFSHFLWLMLYHCVLNLE